jgi:hypothetical protein
MRGIAHVGILLILHLKLILTNMCCVFIKTNIYSRSSRIAIYTFYMEIRPINYLLISLGPIQAIGLLLLISNI